MRKNTATLVALCLSLVVALESLYSLWSLRAPKATEDTTSSAQAAPTQQTSDSSDQTKQPEDDQRETYVSTWAQRIDAFNAGYPLEGYGRTFAEAAYGYGVDPRFSPAIARVESGSGLNCAYSCNAWGWGSQSWGDWGTAIYAHVGGLATNYGPTLSYGIAAAYNELNPDEWYAQVEQCMYQIWGSDSL